MKSNIGKAILVLLVCISLAACGKKEEAAAAPQTTAQAQPVNTTNCSTDYGCISSIVLQTSKPTAYSKYHRMVATEWDASEARKKPDAEYAKFFEDWTLQSISAAAPCWKEYAGIVSPEFAKSTNEVKKADILDGLKKDAKPDPDNVNVIASFQFPNKPVLSKPNLVDGQYYLTVDFSKRYMTLQNYWKGRNTNLYYNVDLPMGMAFNGTFPTAGNSSVTLTVKADKDLARLVEENREQKLPFVYRVYGHVSGCKATAYIDGAGVQAGSQLEISALEFGVRQSGEFVPYWFIDRDQLLRKAL